jgi:hypothetical protein
MPQDNSHLVDSIAENRRDYILQIGSHAESEYGISAYPWLLILNEEGRILYNEGVGSESDIQFALDSFSTSESAKGVI